MDPLVDALHADAPDRELDLRAFGRFVGDWALDWHGRTVDGEPVSTEGRLTFGYVLAGRAVQDVWFVPPAVPGDPGIAGVGFHGSTIRFPDPGIGAWRSTWIEPLNARVRRFIGKPGPEGITLLSVDGEPHLRWSFRDIEGPEDRPGSFTWVGEFSRDGGHTWLEEERMLASRRG